MVMEIWLGPLFVCLCFQFFSLKSFWNTALAGPPEGQAFQRKEYSRVTLRTHQGLPAQEGQATLDFVAGLQITGHCCVEFQKSSGCTLQKGVTYLGRKVHERAVKHS